MNQNQDFEMSVADTLASANSVLHGQRGGSFDGGHHAHVDLSQLTSIIHSIDNAVKTGFAKMESQFDNINDTLKEVISDVNHLKGAVSVMDEDLKSLKEGVIPKLETELRDKITSLEKAKLESELYSKKTNLLFFNIPNMDGAGEDTEAVLTSYLSSVGLQGLQNMTFVNVHRLPTKTAVSGKPDPIIAKFVRMKDRNHVLNFKPTNGKNLTVAPHLPASMQAERKRLIPIRNKKREEGHTAKIMVKGIRVELLVNNKVYRD